MTEPRRDYHHRVTTRLRTHGPEKNRITIAVIKTW